MTYPTLWRERTMASSIHSRSPVLRAALIEPMEPRLLLSTYVVINTNDSGPGSLRDRINYANQNAGATPTTIDFNIPGGGVHTIRPLSPLPAVGNVLIDGYTQPGAHAGTLGTGNDAILLVELDGSLAGAAPGLHLSNGAEVRGLVINRFAGQPAILADPTTPFGNQFQALVTVDGNYLGTDAAGTPGFPDNNAEGIQATGDCLISGNLISGNTGDGAVLSGGAANSPGNVVRGNYMGTDAAGIAAVPNGKSGLHCALGYLNAVEANLICGNAGPGIRVDGSFNGFVDNWIGTNASAPLPNGDSGVVINGLDNALQRNTIAFNHGAGIAVLAITPPWIGEENKFIANSIHDNTGLGIDLNNDGVTPNMPGRPRNGDNHFPNYPVLNYAASGAGGSVVSGTLNGLPWIANATGFLIEFFLNSKPDPSGYGQGETFLSSVLVPADPSGNMAFTMSLDYQVPAGQFISATATEVVAPPPEQNLPVEPISTSEFSADVKVRLMGDVNDDGNVGFDDLAILARNYGKPGTPDQGDVNGDGKINFNDLVLLARNYGSTTAAQPPQVQPIAVPTMTSTNAPFLKRSSRLAHRPPLLA